MASALCNSAQYWQLETVLLSLSEQAAAGARPELLPLMQVKCLQLAYLHPAENVIHAYTAADPRDVVRTGAPPTQCQTDLPRQGGGSFRGGSEAGACHQASAAGRQGRRPGSCGAVHSIPRHCCPPCKAHPCRHGSRMGHDVQLIKLWVLSSLLAGARQVVLARAAAQAASSSDSGINFSLIYSLMMMLPAMAAILWQKSMRHINTLHWNAMLYWLNRLEFCLKSSSTVAQVESDVVGNGLHTSRFTLRCCCPSTGQP